MSVVSYLWSAITELCVHFRRLSHLDVKLSYLPKIQRLSSYHGKVVFIHWWNYLLVGLLLLAMVSYGQRERVSGA